MGKVFFIGDVALDEYYQAEYFPKLKEKIIVHAMPPQMGGSIANAACVFSALGNSPYFLTALNSGDITQKLLDGLEAAGINTRYMVFDDAIPDAKCIIILAEKEHTVFISTLGLQRIDITEETYQALADSDYIYTTFCEIRPLKYHDKNALEVIENIKQGGTQIWCDLDCADLSEEEAELFPIVDVAFVNEKGEENLIKRFGTAWKERLYANGTKLIVVTKAGNGCSVCKKGKGNLDIEGIRVPVVDVTGAGDTFGSSFLHAYRRTGDAAFSAKFANFMAARAVTGAGARYGAADEDTVLAFIEAHGGNQEDYRILF